MQWLNSLRRRLSGDRGRRVSLDSTVVTRHRFAATIEHHSKEISESGGGRSSCDAKRVPPRVPFQHNGRVAQLEEARRRERRECCFKSSRDYHFEPEAIKTATANR